MRYPHPRSSRSSNCGTSSLSIPVTLVHRIPRSTFYDWYSHTGGGIEALEDGSRDRADLEQDPTRSNGDRQSWPLRARTVAVSRRQLHGHEGQLVSEAAVYRFEGPWLITSPAFILMKGRSLRQIRHPPNQLWQTTSRI